MLIVDEPNIQRMSHVQDDRAEVYFGVNNDSNDEFEATYKLKPVMRTRTAMGEETATTHYLCAGAWLTCGSISLPCNLRDGRMETRGVCMFRAAGTMLPAWYSVAVMWRISTGNL
ncbi:hypothetical protein AHAS_Ahas16G0086100 [Arachis hypogaea]